MQIIRVSPQDTFLLEKHQWFIKSNGYVTAKINNTFVLLHRLIMHAKAGSEIDHINRNKLDNRRENLRFSTRSKNMHNATYKKGISGILGVTLHTQNKNWVARIRLNGKRKHLGSFSRKEDAEDAYLKALQLV